ncbi:hypothetical protein SOVF_170560 isoform A [Spinacia oleracea]|uniref:Uncharacterized protein LOC110797246 n=1 Tax=Spinacia oleracea TaxID=3562 RepID=A0A9R0IYJ3_SPIOL|nr:uncharacterized protein LOC110797246 isoform X2 [Spinacia oleracea]XP_056698814.1 uncharacterized protein LOC110797246 isoform X2 [Spinacia oleracea]XP_056698815.1 uncharacterized protein LOC110797246 isoform X2 [Spinacia oleracea]KNA07574.1 hypothetical protein SOVF_170560 isoform A [Spinacia oleracea]
MRNPRSQVTGFSSSPTSQFSEPPDIKKWFSSYNYQSPELNTNEDFCFSHGVDDKERGLFVEDSETEDEGNFEDLAEINRSVAIRKSIEEAKKHDSPSVPVVEVPAFPDSLSIPSEPPDITKWFSSYVYESPELDSADFDVPLSSGYTFGDVKEVDKEKEVLLKESPVTEVEDELLSYSETIITPSGVENRKNPPVDGLERSNFLPKNSSYLKRTSDQRTSEELNDCNTLPDKSVVYPRNKDEDLLPVKATYGRGKRVVETAEKNTEKKFTAAETNTGWISLNRKPREEYSRSIIKERGEHISPENQFSSMKNKARPRINKENSPVKSDCFSDGKNDKRLRREILRETTNFNLSHLPEVAGKWKCPQKHKPDTGPPMKQLRLERWIHKI